MAKQSNTVRIWCTDDNRYYKHYYVAFMQWYMIVSKFQMILLLIFFTSKPSFVTTYGCMFSLKMLRTLAQFHVQKKNRIDFKVETKWWQKRCSQITNRNCWEIKTQTSIKSHYLTNWTVPIIIIILRIAQHQRIEYRIKTRKHPKIQSRNADAFGLGSVAIIALLINWYKFVRYLWSSPS